MAVNSVYMNIERNKYRRRDFLKLLAFQAVGCTPKPKLASILEKDSNKIPGKIPDNNSVDFEINTRFYQEDTPLPLWLLGTWGRNTSEYLISGVVLEGLKPLEGDMNDLPVDHMENQILQFSVGVMNPFNNQCSVFNVRLFNQDVVVKTSAVVLPGDDFIEPLDCQENICTYSGGSMNYMISKQELTDRLEVGNQISFSLITSIDRLEYYAGRSISQLPESVKESVFFQELINDGINKNKYIVQEMINYETPRDSTAYSFQFIFPQ